MNQNLINQYQITLQNKVLNWSSGDEIFKSIETNNRYLNEFIDSWSVEEMDEWLLPYLDQVINGTLQEYDTGSETITILIKQDLTYFLIDGVGTNYPTIPTQDFKEICLGWKEFLLTPPLNGTKVS
jgi:hypothetical protein